MDTLEFRDKMRHFFAVNQINIAEFKHLLGTILLFTGVGGIHGIMLNYLNIKKGFYLVSYYLIFAAIGISLYLQLI
jgi:hypothetical protein